MRNGGAAHKNQKRRRVYVVAMPKLCFLPPSQERGGGWLPQRDERKRERSGALTFPFIPSGAEGSFSFAIICFMRESACMKHRAFKSYEARCFPLPAVLLLLLDRERKRFLAFARNDECGEAAFSYRKPSEWEQYSASFQRKEAV